MVTATLAWFQYPWDNPAGSYGKITDPLGPYLKPDVNIAVPAGVIVTSLTGGVVTSTVDKGCCCGGLTVTILMDVPLNSVATHASYNFLGSQSVRVGQRVSAGDQIGVAGSPCGIDLAVGLTPDPVWGSTNFNLNARGDPRLDPHLLLTGAKPSGVNLRGLTGFLSTSAIGPAFISVSNTTHAILNNVPGFQGLAEGLDNAETFVPFKMKSTGGQDVGILGHLPFIGQDIQNTANLATLPSDTIQAVLTFVTANTLAFVLRTLIVIIGIVIIITLIRNSFIGRAYGEGIGKAVNVGQKAIMASI